MADAIFEYVDKNNKTRRVDDIYKVPEEYRGNVLVIGVEEQPKKDGKDTTTGQQAEGGIDFGGFDLHNFNPPKSSYVVLIAAILFLRSKNYLFKCVLGGSICLWGVYYGGQWFAQSEFMKTSVDQMAEDGRKNPLINRDKPKKPARAAAR